MGHQTETIDLDATMASLSETALRVKAERDEAIKLLREVLGYSTIGSQGPFKTKVRAFLAEIAEAAAEYDEPEPCPSCRTGLAYRCHHEGDLAYSECWYWRCERCGHQWGFE